MTKDIENFKKKERNFISKYVRFFMLSQNLSTVFPMLVIAVVSTVILLFDIEWNISKAIALITYAGLYLKPSIQFGIMINAYRICSVASDRLDKYLNTPEIDVHHNNLQEKNETVEELEDNNEEMVTGSIKFRNFSGGWFTKKISKYYEDHENDISKNAIIDVSLDINPGDFVAVVGEVGSGKSSFLLSILNELDVRKGSVKTSGSVGYIP